MSNQVEIIYSSSRNSKETGEIIRISPRKSPRGIRPLKANFHSGKLSVDWNGQENFSLSCELWVGTNDFNTKKNFLVRSNPRIIFLNGN